MHTVCVSVAYVFTETHEIRAHDEPHAWISVQCDLFLSNVQSFLYALVSLGTVNTAEVG
jgi:hypothetical protein